ncbi:MAG: oxaloacetate decarboxylase (Na+ extruding) subunit alpha, partial [Solirubrobacteraceae bacterium]|nr:oxaloacetate decarboxylase (Na+ extruding) subunit alpha [Solirubrobacteraceae bacterium]
MSRHVELIDTTTRDGNQSLWGATGLTTPDVLSIAPTMDRVGYHALDFTSSTAMAVSVRYHREDPWERIRMATAAMPNTPLGMITTGKRFISWRPAGDDVLRAVFRSVVRNGLRRVQFADPMNDPDDLAEMARIAKEEGVEEVVIGLTYSVSPVHTDAYYATRAAAMGACPDVDRLYLKDPGGLISIDRLRDLAPLFLQGAAGRPVELHSHCTIGLAPQVYLEGATLGFSGVHTAVAPVANGTSQPAAEWTVHNLEAIGFSVDL